MDERLRETLSAMMDDEADELSVRRLLSQADQDGMRSQWRRWQEIRDLMHDNHGPAAGLDIAGAVRARLDDQTAPGHAESVTGSGHSPKAVGWHWPVAVMVTLALVIGFGAGTGWDARSSQPLAGNDPSGQEQDASLLAVSGNELVLQGLDEDQRRQMRQFLLEHAQHNSVGVGRGSVGYARLVSASDGY